MNIQVIWDNETKKTIRYIFQKGWTWQDVREALKQAATMMEPLQHKVNVIMDFRQASMIPQGAISEAQRAFANPRPGNLNLTIFVGDSFVHRLIEVATKLYNPKAKKWDMAVVKTLDDAYALLAEDDQHDAKPTPPPAKKEAT
jgi:hypothetical protein